MELHPFLETDIRPAPKWWYVLPSSAGEPPSMRVGHSATFVPGSHTDEHDRVFYIGGANPSQVFNEVFVFDLKTRSWDRLEAPGFHGRYEHSAFRIESQPGKIFIYGGATQEGNLNDVQCLDTSTGQWTDLELSGEAPSPRTHRSAAVVGDKVYYFSGGQSGSDPVSDKTVYCLDVGRNEWSKLTPRGDSPKPRHGHMMVTCRNKVYLHGGMAGSTFFDDLHILDLDKNSWSNVRKKRSNPPPRAAHDGVAHGDSVYMFGGMSGAGALDDAYVLNTESNTWTRLAFEGPCPANRLDFALCVAKMSVPVAQAGASGAGDVTDDVGDVSGKVTKVLERELKPGSASSRDSDCSVNEALYVLETDPAYQAQKLCEGLLDAACGDDVEEEEVEVETEEVTVVLINGGMDTEGEIFDDTLVLLL